LGVASVAAPADVALPSRVFRALADASRLRILVAVSGGERRVSDVVALTGMSQPNVSKHLAALHDCGLVERDRRGREVFYAASDGVGELLRAAERLVERVADCTDGCTD
jgi:DNA-binding transcriptional ArsR family regulator